MYQYGLSCVLVSAALPNATDLEAYFIGLAYFHSVSLFHETLLNANQVRTGPDRDFLVRGHPHFRSFLMRKFDMTRTSKLYLFRFSGFQTSLSRPSSTSTATRPSCRMPRPPGLLTHSQARRFRANINWIFQQQQYKDKKSEVSEGHRESSDYGSARQHGGRQGQVGEVEGESRMSPGLSAWWWCHANIDCRTRYSAARPRTMEAANSKALNCVTSATLVHVQQPRTIYQDMGLCHHCRPSSVKLQAPLYAHAPHASTTAASQKPRTWAASSIQPGAA